MSVLQDELTPHFARPCVSQKLSNGNTAKWLPIARHWPFRDADWLPPSAWFRRHWILHEAFSDSVSRLFAASHEYWGIGSLLFVCSGISLSIVIYIMTSPFATGFLSYFFSSIYMTKDFFSVQHFPSRLFFTPPDPLPSPEKRKPTRSVTSPNVISPNQCRTELPKLS